LKIFLKFSAIFSLSKKSNVRFHQWFKNLGERDQWNNTIQQQSDSYNSSMVSATEEDDLQFNMTTLIERIPNAASTLLECEIATEMEESFMSSFADVSAVSSVDQNALPSNDASISMMLNHQDKLTIHAINKISGRISRRRQIENNTTVKDWVSLVYNSSDSENDSDVSDENDSEENVDSTIIERPKIPVIEYSNGTPYKSGYRSR